MHNQKQLQYIRLRVADEKKVASTSNFAKCKCKHQMKLKKPIVRHSRELQPVNRNNMVHYRQNNNWTQTGIILNKNKMPLSYTLLNNKDNVIRRNRCNFIKIASNIVNNENEGDMDNNIETKSKTRQSISA